MLPKPENLLAWYDRHGRVLPWRLHFDDRAAGNIPDAYCVWLSEIMLQQTGVVTAKPYFEKFVTAWPTVRDLSRAERDDILKAWAGLGYYSRARNLKACADKIVSDYDGRFPENPNELKKLPGIGDYTAAAIAAIAFDRPACVIDGNVERVISRIFAISEPLPGAKKAIRTHATTLTPNDRPGDYAQAMMDLGATICTPRKPSCPLCPWREACRAYRHHTPEDFPYRAPRPPKPSRYGHAFVAVRADGAVLLRKRAEKGLLGGMSEIPGTLWCTKKSKPAPEDAPLPAGWAKKCGTIRHTFTHFHLEIEVVMAEFAQDQKTADGYWWSDRNRIADEALPSVMKKIIAIALPGYLKQ